MSSGSTIINFTLTSSKVVSLDTFVSFNFILYKLDGSQKTVPVEGTIVSGTDSVIVTKSLKDDFATVDTTKYTIRDESTNNSDFTVTRYKSKSLEGGKTSDIVYDFVSCCDDTDIIPILVDSRAVGDNGWVNSRDGGVISFKGSCYKPLKTSKSSKPVATFYGPDYSSCRVANCECITPTPTPTPTTESPILSTNFTLRVLLSVDGKDPVSVNINNKDKDKKAFFYNGACYRLSDDDYRQGVNNPRRPIMKSKDTYSSINACKASNALPLNVVLKGEAPDSIDALVQSFDKKYRKKITFNPKSFSAQEVTTTINALAACGETVVNPDIFVFYDS